MKPYTHQIIACNEAIKKLRKYGLVYLAMEERTGKTLTSLLICEKIMVERILIVTKKKALPGWETTLIQANLKKDYTLINFESLHKLTSNNFDIVIIDEAHFALSGYPKPSKTAQQLRHICYNKLCIYLSATPNAESYSQLYHQFYITKFSPFINYKNFYAWHRDFGVECVQHLGSQIVKKYNKTKDSKVKEATGHLFISLSRKDIGFEVEPVDNVVFVDLESETIKILKELQTTKVIQRFNFVADSVSKEMSALHQIEGGTLKLDSKISIKLGNLEKINFIKQNYGDTESLVIMYNFVAEKDLLSEYFSKAILLQSTASAEGVDLSHVDKLVIYSMNFSASKFIQRRARQCNLHRKDPIEVDFLLVKGGISEMAYTAITKDKMNLTQNYYKSHLSDYNL